MMVRDVMSLPIRKRKLYLQDDAEEEMVTVMANDGMNGNAGDLTQQRKSSVIQFAKAS